MKSKKKKAKAKNKLKAATSVKKTGTAKAAESAKDEQLKKLSRAELLELIHNLQERSHPDAKTAEKLRAAETEYDRHSYRTRFFKVLRSTCSVLLVAAAAAVLLATLFFPVVEISGDSMEPSLRNGDIVLLLKSDPYDRGDLCCVSWQNKLLVKRIIGCGGDEINIDNEGNVSVNGQQLDEPYVSDKSLGQCDITFPYFVPEGRFFVMGDRRAVSVDSRSTAVGCVETEQIVGRILFRIWPIGK